MTDVTTNKPLVVRVDGTAGPYIMVPLTQVEDVKRLLDHHGVRHWVDEDAISYNGAPYITVVNFGRRGDAASVQAILDSAR